MADSNAVSTGLLSFLGGKVNSESDTGAGLVFGSQSSTSDNRRSLTYTDQTENSEMYISYNPVTSSYTIPIITISGSTVSETGNTNAATNPTSSLTPYQAQTQTAENKSDGDKNGIDLTSLIVPAIAIAGGGILAYSIFKAAAK